MTCEYTGWPQSLSNISKKLLQKTSAVITVNFVAKYRGTL